MVTTNTSALVKAESGASIRVPEYAVPSTLGGEEGKMVFSLERDKEITRSCPAA